MFPKLCPHNASILLVYDASLLLVIVSSFLELVPAILKLPGVNSFLSAKLNQDAIEKFFGCVRQHGRVNNNPTVLEALQSTQTLRVINSLRFASITGNCRGTNKRKALTLEDCDAKLPPKKKKSHNKLNL